MQSRKSSKNTEAAALILPRSNQDKFTENRVEPGLDLWIRLSRCRKDRGKECSKHKQKLQGCYQAAAVSGEVWEGVGFSEQFKGRSESKTASWQGQGGGGGLLVQERLPRLLMADLPIPHPPLQQQVIQEYSRRQIGVSLGFLDVLGKVTSS